MRWPDRLLALAMLALVAGGCASAGDEGPLPEARGPWRREGPVRRLVAGNLHEQIDGAAPFVISFGFESLAVADYRRGDEPPTAVELYDMGSADNAFALFRSNANVEAQPLAIGTEGAGGDGRVEFWQGPHYVVVSNPVAEEGEHVTALARDLAAALPPTDAWPAYLDLLPTRGRVARSEQYLPADFLGREFLVRTVVARYKVGNAKPTLFVCRYDTPAEAAQAYTRLEAALGKAGPPTALAIGEAGFVAADSTYGHVAAMRRGRFLAGMTGYVAGEAADALLADLDAGLGGR